MAPLSLVKVQKDDYDDDEHDFGITHTFVLSGKCYGVWWYDSTLYEMNGKIPLTKVGIWDWESSYPIFHEVE